MTTTPEAKVHEAQVRGWSHPAVQRLRYALETTSDGDCQLQHAVDEVLLKGGLMSSFLPFPFTAESPEGVRLSSALARAKKRYRSISLVQDFRFKFWNPHDAVDDGQLFEEAFIGSLTHSAAIAARWPRNWR